MTAIKKTQSIVIYFSSVSNNTHRFVNKLNLDSERIPIYYKKCKLFARKPFFLITPTYGGGLKNRGYVPKQVVKFLNILNNRTLLKGVISSGNKNFGDTYCLAGDIIAAKCNVNHIYKFELAGTNDDVDKVNKGLKNFEHKYFKKK